MQYIFLALFLSMSAVAQNKIINGRPAGDMFPAVGTFNYGCTITKVGPRQFISAAHCVDESLPNLNLNFKNYTGRVKVSSFFVHPSWLKDCSKFHCTGEEVGSERMTPGRSDVVYINVQSDTPKIPITPIHFGELSLGTEVAMVGAGCTGSVEPGGQDSMRYATTKIISPDRLNHEHSLYRNIAKITGESNWVTAGYDFDNTEASLCPGDSGGPLLTKIDGVWNIVGIAADYTFDGRYQDGAPTITNLHTRLDDHSYNNIGAWIRKVRE